MQIRQPQTPGIGGLKELTSAELAFIQGLAGGSFVEGDLFYYTAGAITRFPIGTNGQILSSDGTDPVWSSAGAGDMVLATIQTVTAAKTFNSGKLILAGATSGTTILNSGAIAGSSVLTLPVAIHPYQVPVIKHLMQMERVTQSQTLRTLTLKLLLLSR